MEQRSFLFLLVLMTLLFLFLLRPFGAAIFWACIIGLIFLLFTAAFWQQAGRRPISQL